MSHRGCIGDIRQVTLYPSVAYYCPNEGCNKMVTHELVHQSDDLKYDAHLIKRFHHTTIQELRKRKIPIHKKIQFSDQCPFPVQKQVCL